MNSVLVCSYAESHIRSGLYRFSCAAGKQDTLKAESPKPCLYAVSLYLTLYQRHVFAFFCKAVQLHGPKECLIMLCEANITYMKHRVYRENDFVHKRRLSDRVTNDVKDCFFGLNRICTDIV